VEAGRLAAPWVERGIENVQDYGSQAAQAAKTQAGGLARSAIRGVGDIAAQEAGFKDLGTAKERVRAEWRDLQAEKQKMKETRQGVARNVARMDRLMEDPMGAITRRLGIGGGAAAAGKGGGLDLRGLLSNLPPQLWSTIIGALLGGGASYMGGRGFMPGMALGGAAGFGAPWAYQQARPYLAQSPAYQQLQQYMSPFTAQPQVGGGIGYGNRPMMNPYQ
jgi:hypothetical protein